MSDPRTQPIARVGATRLPSETTTKVASASPRATQLSFEVEAEASRVHVQVVERESQVVLRSFPMLLPGRMGNSAETEPRGRIVDAKA